jgi:hypoxanthine phosphoribosyltransferase
MRRPERVVCVAGGGAMSGVALAKRLKIVLPQSASFNT